MAAVFLVPLRQGRRHMHLLDNPAPSHTRIVRAEGNLASLCGVRDNTHFGAPKVVIEQILKPHPRDKHEVPAILPPLKGILDAIGVSLPPIAAADYLTPAPAEFLIELLDQMDESEVLRGFERVVVTYERER